MGPAEDDALVDFFRARLAEDRRTLDALDASAPLPTGAPQQPWDPARLRRDVEARSLVVEYYARMVEVGARPTGDWIDRSLWEVREIVRLLAAAYAGHPDLPRDIALDTFGVRHVEAIRAHP